MIGIRLSFLQVQFPWFEYIYLIIILLLDEGEKGKETVKKKKIINWTVTKEHSDFRCVVFFLAGGGGGQGIMACMKGTLLVVQWLRLCAPSAGNTGFILGQGTKIPHATTKDPMYHN